MSGERPILAPPSAGALRSAAPLTSWSRLRSAFLLTIALALAALTLAPVLKHVLKLAASS
jgi:hypothetical protein